MISLRDNRKGRLLTGFGICLLTALCGVAAQAQQKTETSHKPSSFSDKQAKHKPKPPATPKAVDQQDVADAVLADTLNQLFSETADAHYHKGEYNHILHLYAVVEQGDPHNLETYSNAALLLWSTDRTPDSIAVLKQGVAANPNTYYMYDELGQHYWLRLKDAPNAIPYLEKATTFKDVTWHTYHSLAFCYQKLNQWDKAVQTWKEAVKYVKDDAVAPIKLKQAEAELAKRQGNK